MIGKKQASRQWLLAGVAASAVLLGSAMAGAVTLRYGYQEDPDALDPHQGGTYGGRVIFSALCDKLVDINPGLEIVPQLATAWELSPDKLQLTFKLRQGVVFHDGTPFDAAAVKFNIERAKTLPESKRKGELGLVTAAEVVDPSTVKLVLSQPFAPLLAQLTDRAGMMVSPKAAAELGANLPSGLACAGPFKLVERKAQDSIRVQKFDKYWDVKNIHVDEIVYSYIDDPTVRLARLQSGQIDIAERVSATDLAAVRSDAKLQLQSIGGLATTHLQINTNAGDRAKSPIGQNAKVREAFELAIDRKAINQVAFNGEFVPGNQLNAPSSPWYTKEFPIPARNTARSLQLLKEAGFDRVKVELATNNWAGDLRVAQIIQAMAKEGGFDVEVQPFEGATHTQRIFSGNYEVAISNWSGRADADANMHVILACGDSQNHGKYCNPELDKLLKAARAAGTVEERRKLYHDANAIFLADRPTIPVYHPTWFFGVSKQVQGVTLYPDGLLRPQGIKKSP